MRFSQKQGLFRFNSCYVSIACHVIDMNESHLKQTNTKKKMLSIECRIYMKIIHNFSLKII